MDFRIMQRSYIKIENQLILNMCFSPDIVKQCKFPESKRAEAISNCFIDHFDWFR